VAVAGAARKRLAATRQAPTTMPAPSCGTKQAQGSKPWRRIADPPKTGPESRFPRALAHRWRGGRPRIPPKARRAIPGALEALRGPSYGPACAALRPLQATARGGARKASVAPMPPEACRRGRDLAARRLPARGGHDMAAPMPPQAGAWPQCRPRRAGSNKFPPRHAAKHFRTTMFWRFT